MTAGTALAVRAGAAVGLAGLLTAAVFRSRLPAPVARTARAVSWIAAALLLGFWAYVSFGVGVVP